MKAALQFSGDATIASSVPAAPRALVVEACPEHRHMVRTTLALAGYTVHAVADATAALQALRELLPDLIVTGIEMEGPCDGLGLCDIVRARTRLRDCAVVVISGSADLDRLRRIEEAGAHVVLHEPVTPADLVVAVREAEGRAGPGAETLARRPRPRRL
jgi:CheY-like chemotaxis protein